MHLRVSWVLFPLTKRETTTSMWCARLHSASPVFTSPFLIYFHTKAALRLSCQPSLLSVAPGSTWETSQNPPHSWMPWGGSGHSWESFAGKSYENTFLLSSQTPSNLYLHGSLVPRLSSPPVMAHHSFLPLHFSSYFSDPIKCLASTTPNGKETHRWIVCLCALYFYAFFFKNNKTC